MTTKGHDGQSRWMADEPIKSRDLQSKPHIDTASGCNVNKLLDVLRAQNYHMSI